MLLRLEFLGELAAVRHALKGYAAAETGETLRRSARAVGAAGLSNRPSSTSPSATPATSSHRGQLKLAKRLDQDLLRAIAPRNDTSGIVLSHFSAGRTALFMGEFEAAQTHLQQAIALYDPIDHEFLHRMAGLHHRTNSQGFLSITLFCLGQPSHALAASEAAVAEAQTVSNPFTHVVSLLLAATLAALAGEHDRMAEHAQALIAQATLQGFPPYVSQGTLFQGWGMAVAGAPDAGIELIRNGLEGYRSTGAATWLGFYNTLLARACALAGRYDEAATILAETIHAAKAGEEALVRIRTASPSRRDAKPTRRQRCRPILLQRRIGHRQIARCKIIRTARRRKPPPPAGRLSAYSHADPSGGLCARSQLSTTARGTALVRQCSASLPSQGCSGLPAMPMI